MLTRVTRFTFLGRGGAQSTATRNFDMGVNLRVKF